MKYEPYYINGYKMDMPKEFYTWWNETRDLWEPVAVSLTRLKQEWNEKKGGANE